MTLLVVLAFFCSTVPAVLWVWNFVLYREPEAEECPLLGHCTLGDSLSVLIPARNEERVIAASLTSLLASRGVDMEIIVLDDDSTDRTAEIVRTFAERDPRVRLASAPSSASRLERQTTRLLYPGRDRPFQHPLFPRCGCPARPRSAGLHVRLPKEFWR